MTEAASLETRHDAGPTNEDRLDHIPDDIGDIGDRADIIGLLRVFYGRCFRDELLGPVFVDIAGMDLDAHLPVICDFWETVLFKAGSYKRNALQPHQRLHSRANLTETHFARWLTLWQATVDDRHVGPIAELAKLQARRMAGAMSRRITGAAPASAATARATIPAVSGGSQHRAHR